MKTILATSLLALTLAACGGAGSSAAPSAMPTGASATITPSTAPSAAPSQALIGTPLIVKDFTLEPLTVVSEGSVVLAVTNAGPTLHNVAIRDGAGAVLGTTADLREGESETLAVDLAAGEYILFCSLAGHESLGIKGTLTVE
ncbi:MAG: cupredoxin domain-containing protein [Candidatus Limnocylindria bacterium]